MPGMLSEEQQDKETAYEEKNIRRRVYDALNVLLALNIISKERKTIRWVGVPSDAAHTVAHLEREGVSAGISLQAMMISQTS